MKQLVHGGDIYTAMEKGNDKILDFSANINPLGLPEGVKAAAAQALNDCTHYPDPLCRELGKALSETLNVPIEYLIFGNGAADLIFRLVLAEKPRKALVLAPTFAEYEEALKTVSCKVEHVYLEEEEGFHLGASFLDKLNDSVDMVFLCNPNNPTGQLIQPELLRRILKKCARQKIRLVVDECFLDFLDEPKQHTLQKELAQYPALFLLRAFTKIFAMPGLRLGFGLCRDGALLDKMTESGQPWGVSLVAQKAGIQALRETAYLRRTRDLIAEERRWLQSALEGLGYKVYPPRANYVFFRVEECDFLAEDLAADGILIRSCENYIGLDRHYFRIAVRGRSENEELIQALSRRETKWQDRL